MKRISAAFGLLLFLTIWGNTLFAEDNYQAEIQQQQQEKMRTATEEANDRIEEISSWRATELERIKKETATAVEGLQKEINAKVATVNAKIIKLQEETKKFLEEANAKNIKLQEQAALAGEKTQKEAEIRVQEVINRHKQERERIKTELQQKLRDGDGQPNLSGGLAPGMGPSFPPATGP